MPTVEAYLERKTKDVLTDTWGHLAPQAGESYKGHIIYAVSEYGDIVLIKARFYKLEDSPWLFDNMQDFIGENSDETGVFRWDGTYKCYKNGNHKFSGKIRQLIA